LLLNRRENWTDRFTEIHAVRFEQRLQAFVLGERSLSSTITHLNLVDRELFITQVLVFEASDSSPAPSLA
jgi:hypothetical protein